MKKLLTFLTLLTLSIGIGWAETKTATLSWAGNGSASNDGSTALTVNNILSTNGGGLYTGDANVATATEVDKIYTGRGQNGLKLGTGSATGSMTFSINGNLKPSKITVSACPYNTSDKTLKIVVNGESSLTFSTTEMSTGFNNYEVTMDGNTTLSTIQVSTTSKRAYVDAITITYEEGGTQPTTVTQPTITLDPASVPYYEGDEVTATLACETEGATIYYRLNDDATWTEYSTALTLTQTTTIHAKAVLGTDESSEKTQTVTFKKSVANIAAFKALSDADAEDFKFTGDLVVTYFSSANNASGYVWVKDKEANGYTLLYGNDLTVNTGNIIKGGWTGKRTIYKGLIEITNMSQPTIEQGNGTVSPLDLNYTDHFISTDFQAVYGKLSGVTISAKSNSNFTITDGDGHEITGRDTYNLTWPSNITGKTFDITGIISVYNDPQFIPVLIEDAYIDPGEGYYLVGNFSDWKRYESYRFTEIDGSLVLNNVTLPDNAEFKIVNKTSSSEIWYGGRVNNPETEQNYGIDGSWHNNIPMENSYNNDYWVKNYKIAAGGVTSFTLNTSTMKFDVARDAQVYFTCDKINNWQKVAMTSTDNGWTISQVLEAGAKFAFLDEWGGHHGKEWTIKPEHYGNSYDIPIETSDLFEMQDAGTYILDVNNALSVLHVNKAFNINCSAVSDIPNGQGGYRPGGTVKALVDENEVTSAMSGTIVTLSITANDGYTFSNNVTLNDEPISANNGTYSFEMPTQDANVVANFTANSYAIEVTSLYGTTTCPNTAKTGQVVSFTIAPQDGYSVMSVTVTPGSVTVTENEGTYSFVMPPYPVSVVVTYNEPLQPCTIPFVETWDGTVNEGDYTGCTGGNDEQWSGTIAQGRIVSDRNGWEYFAAGGGYKCVKFGTSNTTGGSATTPQIVVSNGTIYKMTFRAGGWGSDYSVLYLSATGAELYSDEGCNTAIEDPITLNNSAWGSYTVYVKASASLMTIKFYNDNKKKRIFLDDVNIDYFETPVPTEATLAQIITLGENADGKLYKISNEDGLLGVYKKDNSIWFKDEDGEAIDYQPWDDSFKDYAVVDKDENGNVLSTTHQKDLDQSNWIEVVFTSDANYVGSKVKNLTGTYSYNNGNPKLTITQDVAEGDVTDAVQYTPNNYICANFEGNQEYTNSQDVTSTYFFPMPKAQEYARIMWAVWDKDAQVMRMPTTNNVYGFTGSFTLTGVTNAVLDNLDNNHDGDAYNFFGIILKKTTRGVGDTYEVYPLNLNPDTPTAISTISVNGEVKSVKYVNVAGIVSDTPFQGINIVVTEYTDGSRTTSKMLKK